MAEYLALINQKVTLISSRMSTLFLLHLYHFFVDASFWRIASRSMLMSQFYQTPGINGMIFNNRVKLRLNTTIINIEKTVNWFTLGLL